MSNKKSKTIQNNENLCPIVRKRVASTNTTTPQATWKLAKLESTSSPTALTLEDLEEMGIGMLDSEESSSSAASAIALAMSASPDENSNEATPNLDAPKFCHQPRTYHPIDISFDSSIDNGNISLTDSDETCKATTASVTKLTSNSVQRANNNFQIYADEQQIKSKEKLAPIPPNKKVAIVGAGAGIVMTTTSNSSNSNSPSSGRATRSPLATVACNSQFRNANAQQQLHQHMQQLHQQMQQQQHQNQQSLHNVSTTNRANNIAVVISQQSLQNQSQQQQLRTLSPSVPSTSQRAVILKRQQQNQHNQHDLQKNLYYMRQHLVDLQHNQLQTTSVSTQYEPFFIFRNQSMVGTADGEDHFKKLSDEIILQILKWLPKKTLLRCGMVCRRFNQCAADESLWTRLDLGGRALRAGAMENILPRGVVVMRLAQAQLSHPVFEQPNMTLETRLQYLDLSMAAITKPSLKMILSRCRQLKKLSLEHVPVNDEICNEIAKNIHLEALNLGMCTGLEAWSVRKMMESLQNLNSLNISWTNLSADAVTSLVTNVTPNLMRLNIAGCRKTMFDLHLDSLAKRCTQLLELDLSDCNNLSGNAITIICQFKMLEYLSLSRCYLIPASSYMELSNLSTLTYLDIFSILSDSAMEMFKNNFPNLGINKFIYSSVARPTVGTRRTSIWGLRTRD